MGGEQREAASQPADGDEIIRGKSFPDLDKTVAKIKQQAGRCSKRNSKVNCQISPSPEARQCVQSSPELTTVSTHLLMASQQGLVQPFVVKHRLHRAHLQGQSPSLQSLESLSNSNSETAKQQRRSRRNTDEAGGACRRQRISWLLQFVARHQTRKRVDSPASGGSPAVELLRERRQGVAEGLRERVAAVLSMFVSSGSLESLQSLRLPASLIRVMCRLQS